MKSTPNRFPSVFTLLSLSLLIFMAAYSGAQTANTALNGTGNVFLTANVLGSGGTGPSYLTVADFNGDGHPDIVATNAGNNTIGVLLGKGDGTFNTPISTAVACNPTWAAVGDFNGDGHKDLVVVAPACGPNVDILLGNGDGTFTTKTTFTFTSPQTVSVGDFNGDGKLDIAVVTQGSPDSVLILPGKGDGTFNTPISVSLGASVQSFQAVVADFNKDGHVDLAISEKNGSGFLVLLGKGDGTFLAPSGFSLPAQGFGLAEGDFNNDSIPDLAVTSPADAGVSIFLGDGTGKFTPVNNPGTGTLPTFAGFVPGIFAGPSLVGIGDFNGDGKADVIVTLEGIAALAVLPGNGDGTLGAPLLYATPGNPNAVGIADFNGDGKLDWAVTTNGTLDSITTAFGRGDGTFQAERIFTADNAPAWFAFADFNGDGVQDMIVPNQPANTIDLLLGKKDGTFQAPTGMAFSGNPGMLVTGDFNGDGKQDFVVRNTSACCNPQTVDVYLGNGNGTFQSPKIFSTGGANGGWIVAGDFNGDGKLDLAVSNNDSGPSTIAVLLGNGDGTFQAPIVTSGIGSVIMILVADLNKDSKSDLIVEDSTNQDVTILLGKGDGTFQTPTTLAETSLNAAALGDFNNDGNIDLVVMAGGNANIYLGNGNGTFNSPSTVTLTTLNAPGDVWVATGDFNLDGNLDFVVGASSPRGQAFLYQGIKLILGNGDGTFQAPQEYLAGPGNDFIPTSVGDFNGDGAPDLAVFDLQDSVTVLLNQTQALKVNLAGGGHGSVTSSPAGISCPSRCVFGFSDGTGVTLTAKAATGSIFIGWSGACSGTGTCSVTMDASKSVTATFKLVFPLTVTLAGSGTGSVTSSPAGISCPGTCSANFVSGTVVTLTETPAAGGAFTAWSGACSGTVGCSVTMSAASAVTATFTAVFPLAVSLAGTGKGTVTSSPAGINCPTTCSANFASGAVVVLTETAASGSAFAGWSGACSGTASCSVTMSASKAVAATFNLASGPAVALSPTNVSFGTVAIGSTSMTKTVTLKNTGTASLTITGIAIAGSNAGDFSQTHTCTSSLAVGASCTISVSFKPTASGTRTAAVSITDNAAGSPQKIALSGSGTTAKLSPTSLIFGTVAIGVTSAAKTVALTNLAVTSLPITGISITGTNAGDFSQTHTCTSSLAAGASCIINVIFKPTASGTRTAALSVTDNAAGSPQKVPLSGIGTTAKLSPTSLNFGTVAIAVSSAAKTVTLTNVAATSLTIMGIAITGTNAGDFSQTHTCLNSLAAGASCTISIKFKPTASGTRGAALSVTDNAAGSPQTVSLSGIGTTAKLSPNSLNFGSVTVGTTTAAKTVTLTNAGTTTLTITGIAITGTNVSDFSQTHTCTSSLAAGASCTISVKFKPTAKGARSAALSVSDNAAGTPQKVALSGTGL
jgi:FG-GAP-like repeat/Abnormal spindle-like microcephaly-assoc'd, ASPM-SPD-2-Hydin/Divergent InlB B-repeat domain